MEYPQNRFRTVKVDPTSLVGRKREVVFTNTLFYQLEALKTTGRYDAFKLQWHESYDKPPTHWPVPDHLFWDSDVAKWIEGACYALHDRFDAEIDAAVKELVSQIRGAQQPDGYLNIHFTVVEPGKRFTNLRDLHELYNAGHLIEAALAHNQYYDNDDLLEPIIKYVALLSRTFGPGAEQTHGYPGHPEIELALLRLYRKTRNKEQLELAQYFITERGNATGDGGQHFYKAEAARRAEDPYKLPAYFPVANSFWYQQAHLPIVEQQTIEGHSVRAMYLLTAVADLVNLERHDALWDATVRLWNNMVGRKMYVTGGIGAIKSWEGFGEEYYLPQATDEGGCYSETCAAIGVMMLAERLLKIDLDGRFGDVLELCLYNSVMTGMGHDGREFTYDNQMGSSDKAPSRRERWFTCACCPPNVLRLLGQIGGYIYSWDQKANTQLNIHLFASSSTEFLVDGHQTKITQKTNWPWDGQVTIIVDNPSENLDLAIRIPGWAENWTVSPTPSDAKPIKGYLHIPGTWLVKNAAIKFDIPFYTRLVTSHPLTMQDTLTLVRGPLVYCVEDADNSWVQDHFKTTQLDPECKIEEEVVHNDATQEDYIALTVTKGASLFETPNTALMPFYSAQERSAREKEAQVIDVLRFVPYYFVANRGGRGQMRVGLRRWCR